MADNYTLVASQSTIQVISATVVLDVVVITIQAHPSQVIASLWVTQEEWDAGNTADILAGYAANIETIMASPKVKYAEGGPALDSSRLQAAEITFTVGYTPPGSRFPPATIDVTVAAVTLLPSIDPTYGTVGASGRRGSTGDPAGGGPTLDPGVTAALAAIDAAYAQLVAAAGG